ncbi:hypothetical protein GCM10009680_00530 [Streptomyces yatensis]|uniref:N-acetyltransferase domain-containing protein n=1 Tax=Streptomyces yatensis TaxID=155177 RepID=A0ABP4S1Y5_9ACTN
MSPPRTRPSGVGEAELGYLFLPETWGRGYGAEAFAAALGRPCGLRRRRQRRPYECAPGWALREASDTNLTKRY